MDTHSLVCRVRETNSTFKIWLVFFYFLSSIENFKSSKIDETNNLSHVSSIQTRSIVSFLLSFFLNLKYFLEEIITKFLLSQFLNISFMFYHYLNFKIRFSIQH